MINQIQTNSSADQIIVELIEQSIEVGMVEFTLNEDATPVPSQFQKIGNLELDILAINQKTNEVVLLDHDEPEFVMVKAAKSIQAFVEALKPIDIFFQASIEDELLYDDIDAMMAISIKSGEIAGGKEFSNFYRILFGI